MFRRITLVSVVIVAAFALTIGLTGCGGQQSAIVGTWDRVTPQAQSTLNFMFMEQIEFLSNGTFVLPKFNNMSGKYSFPESDRIKIETSNGSWTYKFTLSGDRLVFDDGGKTIEYRRIK